MEEGDRFIKAVTLRCRWAGEVPRQDFGQPEPITDAIDRLSLLRGRLYFSQRELGGVCL